MQILNVYAFNTIDGYDLDESILDSLFKPLFDLNNLNKNDELISADLFGYNIEVIKKKKVLY